MFRWIRTRRAFQAGAIAAFGALSLALATGATAYIITDDAEASTREPMAMEQGISSLSEVHLDESISDIPAEDPGAFVDPNELYALDVANALRDEETRARAAAEAAQQELEARQRAEAAVAAQRAADAEAARVRAAKAAEEARVAAARTSSAPTPAPTAPGRTAAATAESTVTNALTSAAGWIQEAAAAAGWPAELLPKVERVVMCESGGRTTAVATAGYVGLMQVAPWLHGGVPGDAVGQLAQAYGVYLRQGWGAWPVCGR